MIELFIFIATICGAFCYGTFTLFDKVNPERSWGWLLLLLFAILNGIVALVLLFLIEAITVVKLFNLIP